MKVIDMLCDPDRRAELLAAGVDYVTGRRLELLTTTTTSADPAGTYYDVHPRPGDPHRCTPACIPAPYTGPVLLGRRGEDVTEGRAG